MSFHVLKLDLLEENYVLLNIEIISMKLNFTGNSV